MKLTAAARNRLPDSVFALPGRRFPIHDKSHARVAKSYASRMAARGQLSKEQKAAIFAKANRKLGSGLRRAMGGGVIGPGNAPQMAAAMGGRIRPDMAMWLRKKPIRAKGKITPNDPPEPMMRRGGRMY